MIYRLLKLKGAMKLVVTTHMKQKDILCLQQTIVRHGLHSHYIATR